MGTCGTKTVNNALVMYDQSLTHRWYDAFGAGVTKYLEDFLTLAVDDTTHDPTEWTNTITEAGGGGDSTVAITDAAGGVLLITTDNQSADGYSMQLGHGAGGAGEQVKFDGNYPTYFGVRFKINDVDQTNCFFGLCITDTDLTGGLSDGIYFRSLDESAVLYFVAEKDSVESATAVATLADDTWIVCEFLYIDRTVTAYVNGVEVASLADSATTFPDNEELRLSLEVTTGEATANTCQVDYIKYIHIRD